MVLGNSDDSQFIYGLRNESYYGFFYFLFVLSTFMIMIHLVNMLIAIMGETFGNRAEVASQITVKDHLRFIMDNWHFMGISIKNRRQFRYIIGAMLVEDDNNDQEAISQRRDDVDGMHKAILGNQEENVNQIMTKIEEIQQIIKNRNLNKKRA